MSKCRRSKEILKYNIKKALKNHGTRSEPYGMSIEVSDHVI